MQLPCCLGYSLYCAEVPLPAGCSPYRCQHHPATQGIGQEVSSSRYSCRCCLSWLYLHVNVAVSLCLLRLPSHSSLSSNTNGYALTLCRFPCTLVLICRLKTPTVRCRFATRLVLGGKFQPRFEIVPRIVITGLVIHCCGVFKAFKLARSQNFCSLRSLV
jgi:hypothetical protein